MPVRLQDFTAHEQVADVGGDHAVPRMRAHLEHARVERPDAALQGFERHGGGEVEQRDEPRALLQHKRPVRGHHLRAVDEGQAVLGTEFERLQIVSAKGLRRGNLR